MMCNSLDKKQHDIARKENILKKRHVILMLTYEDIHSEPPPPPIKCVVFSVKK